MSEYVMDDYLDALVEVSNKRCVSSKSFYALQDLVKKQKTNEAIQEYTILKVEVYENDPNISCGAEGTCSHCGADVYKIMNYCYNCGNELDWTKTGKIKESTKK